VVVVDTRFWVVTVALELALGRVRSRFAVVPEMAVTTLLPAFWMSPASITPSLFWSMKPSKR
jgi:hypothetical protein